MARPREPVSLLEAKGRKHLTKDERKKRLQSEVSAPADEISPPAYLTAKQKKEFAMIADQLGAIGIMANVDCDTLALYIKSRTEYVEYGKTLRDIQKRAGDTDAKVAMADTIAKYDTMRDKAFKRCLSAARELGLTISSRCRLVMPKQEDSKEMTGMEAFLKGRDGVV